MKMERVVLIIIDSLRFDTFYKCMKETRKLLNSATQFLFHHSHSCITEPSIISILTGRYPQEHGVLSQPLDEPKYRFIFKDSLCFTSSTKVADYFEMKFVGKKWIEEIEQYEVLIHGFKFILIHIMNLHDLTYDDLAPNASKKLKEKNIPIKAPNPREKIKVLSFDEWKELYESTATMLDEKLSEFLNSIHDEKTLTILTADHGEQSGGEHMMLFEETLHVPLLIDDGEKRIIKNITEHKDLLYGLREKEYFIAAQKHWIKQEVIGSKTHKVYVTYNHRPKRRFVRIYGLREEASEPDDEHINLLNKLIEFSNSIKDNPVKYGIPRYIEFEINPDLERLKKWLKGFGL